MLFPFISFNSIFTPASKRGYYLCFPETIPLFYLPLISQILAIYDFGLFLFFPWILYLSLGGSQAGDGYPERRAGNIVQAYKVAKLNG